MLPFLDLSSEEAYFYEEIKKGEKLSANKLLSEFYSYRLIGKLTDFLLVRQAAYIVNLSEFYSYRLIGKLTDFLQIQEFSLRRHTQVASSPFAARLSSRSYRAK
jgi:hypothetical protein